MSDDYSSGNFEARRRKLDELFSDQPFLSATMKASRMHERLADTPSTLHIPVLPVSADDEMLKRMEAARSGLQLSSTAISDLPSVVEIARTPEHVDSPPARPAEVPVSKTIKLDAPKAAPQLTPASNVMRLDLVLDTSVSPPQVRQADQFQDRKLDVMTIPEAAEFLRISASMLRGLMINERMPAVRIGRKVRFRREAILEWLAAREA